VYYQDYIICNCIICNCIILLTYFFNIITRNNSILFNNNFSHNHNYIICSSHTSAYIAQIKKKELQMSKYLSMQNGCAMLYISRWSVKCLSIVSRCMCAQIRAKTTHIAFYCLSRIPRREERPRLTSMHFLRTHSSLPSQARGLINGSGRANPDHGQRSSTISRAYIAF